MNALRRPRDPGLDRRRNEAPDVDVLLSFLEWRDLEQRGHQTPGVSFELAALGSGVAVAEHEQVQFLRGIAGFVDFDIEPAAGIRAPRSMNLSPGSTANLQIS